MKRGRDILDIHDAWNAAMRLNQDVTVRCGLCDQFLETGTLYMVRRNHQAHRAKHHPEIRERKHKQKGRRGQVSLSNKTVGENIAGARAQGAATWDGAAA